MSFLTASHALDSTAAGDPLPLVQESAWDSREWGCTQKRRQSKAIVLRNKVICRKPRQRYFFDAAVLKWGRSVSSGALRKLRVV